MFNFSYTLHPEIRSQINFSKIIITQKMKGIFIFIFFLSLVNCTPPDSQVSRLNIIQNRTRFSRLPNEIFIPITNTTSILDRFIPSRLLEFNQTLHPNICFHINPLDVPVQKFKIPTQRSRFPAINEMLEKTEFFSKQLERASHYLKDYYISNGNRVGRPYEVVLKFSDYWLDMNSIVNNLVEYRLEHLLEREPFQQKFLECIKTYQAITFEVVMMIDKLLPIFLNKMEIFYGLQVFSKSMSEKWDQALMVFDGVVIELGSKTESVLISSNVLFWSSMDSIYGRLEEMTLQSQTIDKVFLIDVYEDRHVIHVLDLSNRVRYITRILLSEMDIWLDRKDKIKISMVNLSLGGVLTDYQVALDLFISSIDEMITSRIVPRRSGFYGGKLATRVENTFCLLIKVVDDFELLKKHFDLIVIKE